MNDIVLRYRKSRQLALDWLEGSIRPSGGSAASFSLLKGWSKPYPETTGYIIKTMIESVQQNWCNDRYERIALSLGDWLLEIVDPEAGAWPCSTYPPKQYELSVFNTAQILKGLCALYDHSGADKWKEAAERAALWLADGVDDDGLWSIGNYRPGFNPSYYTQVAWPMIEASTRFGLDRVESAATRVLDRVASLKQENGVILDWGFQRGEPAFTHTIGYTIRGFQEAASLLGREQYHDVVDSALERIIKKAEFTRGRLPGAFDENWRGSDSYVCLTGNAQLAICIMKKFDREKDVRLMNAAAKLVDYVVARQPKFGPSFIKGGVSGSAPIWGRYMALRYPNWAAKYLIDALNMLEERLELLDAE